MEIEIAYPKCNWKPDGEAHWQCSCGQLWDTFSTIGKCPSCGIVYVDTQCPGPESCYPWGCNSWSPHIDWYKNLGEEMRKEDYLVFGVD